MSDWAETRIENLHQKFKTIAARESQWNHFAQVLRDNARAVDAVLKERSENIHTMSAVDDLRSYEQLVDALAQGLKKVVPARASEDPGPPGRATTPGFEPIGIGGRWTKL